MAHVCLHTLMHYPLANTWGRHLELQYLACGAKHQKKRPRKEEENHKQEALARSWTQQATVIIMALQRLQKNILSMQSHAELERGRYIHCIISLVQHLQRWF